MARSDLSYWKEEIRKAKLYQANKGRLERWSQYKKYYRNEYKDSLVSVNKVFGIGRAMIPQLYFKAPTILVRPRPGKSTRPQASSQAKILEKIDSWLIDHMGFKLQIKYLILDAFIYNIGVCKFGYHSISTELPTPNDETTQVVAEMIGAPPEEVTEEIERRKWSYHDYIKPDCPWALRIRPQDLLVPWGFCDEHETPWVAYRVIRPVEDVKADPAYANTGRLKPNIAIETSPSGVASPNMFKNYPTNSEFAELFEIWDKRDGMLRVLSMDHDKWLREEEHGLAISGVPSTVLRFNPDGEDFWGVSDVEQIRKQQDELNENRTHEIVTKRLANVKGIVDTNVVPEEELVKLEQGSPGPLIRANASPAAAFTQFRIDVPPDFFRIDETIAQDLREVIGFSRNQTAEFDSSRRTATEAGIVNQAHQLRADERRDLVADFIKEGFQEKVHPMIFTYWTEERVIEVTSLGGWYKYTGPEIAGDYDVSVVPDSVLPLSKQSEQQQAIAAFKLFKGDIRIKQRELYVKVMQAFDDIIADPEELMEDEQNVQKAQQAQMQMQMQIQAMRNSKQTNKQRQRSPGG